MDATYPQSDTLQRPGEPQPSPRAGEVCSFKTADPAQFSEAIAGAAAGVMVEPAHIGDFSVEGEQAILPRVGLLSIHIRNARVHAVGSRDYVSLTVPSVGELAIEVDDRRPESFVPGLAHLLNVDEELRVKALDNRVLVVNLNNNQLAAHGAAVFGERAHAAERRRHIDLTGPAGGSLIRYLHFLWNELRGSSGLLASPFAMREAEEMLMTLVLCCTGSGVGERTPSPAYVARVEDYLRANLSESVSMAELCRLAGVTPRSLARAFRREHGVTPFGYLRRARLEAARGVLAEASPQEQTVTAVATRFGFFHFGRFAGAYLRAFGEKPSDTLRR